MEKEVKSKEKKVNYFNKARENPWLVSTVILAIIGIALVVSLSSGFLNGNVSEKTAGENLISFINSQAQGNASLVSSEKDGSLYKVVVNYDGKDIPVYVTLDGLYLITNPIPLTAAAVDNSNQESTNTNTQASSVPKSDKPVVELFVMSHCPYGTQAEKGIIPVVELLKDKIDFKIRFVSYSMHGKTEVDDNTIQYCIQKEQSSKFLNYMKCFLKEGNSDSCLTSEGIDKTKLDSCIASADTEFNITGLYNDKSSWLNGRYPRYNTDLAGNKEYGVQGSPTLVINGVKASSGRDSASYLKTICAAFNNAPSECNTKLSSTSPSAGFGYSESTTTTGNAAQCS